MPGVTLNGDDQTKSFTMAHTVANTGSGNTAGWNIQVASTTLTSGSEDTAGAAGDGGDERELHG